MNKEIDVFIERVKQFPSGDNCQPWIFSKQDDKTVHILYDKKRDEHDFNKQGSARMIGLGFLLEYINKAAQSLALNPLINIEHFNITIKLEHKSDSKKVDFSTYLLRRCDRRPYDCKLNDSEINEIANCHAYKKTAYSELSGNMKEHIRKSEKTLWTTASTLQSLMKWMRLSKKEYLKTKDGMLYTQLQIKPFEVPSFLFFKNFPKIAVLLFKTPIYFIIKNKIESFYKNTQIIIYTTSNLEQNNINSITSLIISDWAELQSKGFSYQPMNISSIPYLDKFLSNNKIVHEDAKKVLDFIKDENKLDHYPIWVARVGKCKNPYTIEKTLRI
jgi:hypothetical protein